MTQNFSESELLAYVEGELDARARYALEERLNAEPKLRNALAKMREDRAVLRTVGDPELPVDFFAELEPQLARPMLMEQPGSYRKRHRPKRLIRLRPLALAASVLIVTGGAVWISVFGLPTLTPSVEDEGGNLIASNDGAADDSARATDTPQNPSDLPGAGADVMIAMAPRVDEPITGIVHHWGPLPVASQMPASADGAADAGAGVVAELTTTTFALVIRGDAEAALVDVVAALGGDSEALNAAALVRNFSFEEARLLAQRYPQVFSATEPEAPAYASTDERDRPDPPAVVDEYRRHARFLRSLKRQRPAEEIEIPLSAQLAGPEELAPTYESQLAFSSVGATHTVTIPLDALGALLERAHSAAGAETALAVMPDDEAMKYGRSKDRIDAEGLDDPARWVEMHTLLRKFVAKAEADGVDRIQVPVMIIEPEE